MRATVIMGVVVKGALVGALWERRENIRKPRGCPMPCFCPRSYFWLGLEFSGGTPASALLRRRRGPRQLQPRGEQSAPHPARAEPAGEGPRGGTRRAALRARHEHGDSNG